MDDSEYLGLALAPTAAVCRQEPQNATGRPQEKCFRLKSRGDVGARLNSGDSPLGQPG